MSNGNLTDCFVKSLGVEQKEVIDTLTYNEHSKWDSIAHMTLVAALEEAFDIMLDTDDIIDMSSVAKVKELLGKYGVEF